MLASVPEASSLSGYRSASLEDLIGANWVLNRTASLRAIGPAANPVRCQFRRPAGVLPHIFVELHDPEIEVCVLDGDFLVRRQG